MDYNDPRIEDALRRNGIAVSSRLSALAIYAFMGIFVGIFMMLGGAPGLLEEVYGSMIRYWLGGSSLIGGLFLLVGSIQSARDPYLGWWATFLGTLIFAAWTITMATTYGINGIQEGFVVAHFGEAIPRNAPRPYVPFLYQSIAFLAVLHLVTLIRLGRKRLA